MAKATFQPLGDRLLVLLDNVKEEKLVGSIIIPETVREKSSRGTVVAVSDGYWNGSEWTQLHLKVGDRIQFAKYAGLLIDLNDKDELIILSERDVLGVFRFAEGYDAPPADTSPRDEDEEVVAV
jgi:chaperonin GroES